MEKELQYFLSWTCAPGICRLWGAVSSFCSAPKILPKFYPLSHFPLLIQSTQHFASSPSLPFSSFAPISKHQADATALHIQSTVLKENQTILCCDAFDKSQLRKAQSNLFGVFTLDMFSPRLWNKRNVWNAWCCLHRQLLHGTKNWSLSFIYIWYVLTKRKSDKQCITSTAKIEKQRRDAKPKAWYTPPPRTKCTEKDI